MSRLTLTRIPTRPLLLSGIAAGVLFPLAVLAQALIRQGFDLSVHPLSLLSLGSAGWVQVTNFILTGVLMVGFAVGLRRVLDSGPGRRWGPRLLGFYGAILVAAGVFTVDPMYGFPPGAPEGLPATLSWHAIVHQLTFLLAFLGLIIALFVFARRFWTLGVRGFAAYCLLTGLAAPALIVASEMVPGSRGYILFATNVLVHGWLVLLAMGALGGDDSRFRASHVRAARRPTSHMNM